MALQMQSAQADVPIIKHSATLNQRMHEFLEQNTPLVLAYLKTKYAHLLPP
jgi:hypothetical protein